MEDTDIIVSIEIERKESEMGIGDNELFACKGWLGFLACFEMPIIFNLLIRVRASRLCSKPRKRAREMRIDRLTRRVENTLTFPACSEKTSRRICE